MEQRFRYIVTAFAILFMAGTTYGQTLEKREIYKVKKKETIFGIAREHGLTVQELIDANPEMNQPGYELKKGTFIVIPLPKTGNAATGTKTEQSNAAASEANAGMEQGLSQTASAVKQKKGTIHMGVMLPLHDANGDGRRMVEYYRGLLMACDSVRKLGISVDVHAWNTPDTEDITKVFADNAAKQCDFIVGPLYSKQTEALSKFVTKNDIRLVIPFSINAPELLTNRNIFQVYQTPNNINESVIEKFNQLFSGYHPVVIDCHDSTSTKGNFTFGLRRRLEMQGIEYGITSLKSTEARFAQQFSKTLPNVVILNTGRLPELNVALAKLNGLVSTYPELKVTLLGYTEWMMYTKNQLDNFYKFNVYIPAPYHFNPLKSKTQYIERRYRSNFHQDMIQTLPRFAVTGFDHGMFFLQGFARQGKDFTGAKGALSYEPVQTPLQFERLGNGGLKNRCLLMVHYTPDQRMETISF